MVEHTAGTGKFEVDENGLVIERYADGSVSFDVLDASMWPGGDDEGKAFAALIVKAVNHHGELFERLSRIVAELGTRKLPFAHEELQWAIEDGARVLESLAKIGAGDA